MFSSGVRSKSPLGACESFSQQSRAPGENAGGNKCTTHDRFRNPQSSRDTNTRLDLQKRNTPVATPRTKARILLVANWLSPPAKLRFVGKLVRESHPPHHSINPCASAALTLCTFWMMKRGYEHLMPILIRLSLIFNVMSGSEREQRNRKDSAVSEVSKP